MQSKALALTALLVLSDLPVAASPVDLVWSRNAGGALPDRGWAVAVDSRRNAVVAGELGSSTTSDFFTVKYGPTGNVLWSRTYDTGNAERARDVAIDSADSVLVSGVVDGPTAGQWNRNRTVIKYDAAGNLLWARTHNTLSPSYYAAHLAIDGADNVFASGEIEVTKYDAAGNVVWDRDTWVGAWGQYMSVLRMAVDSHGDLLLTGAIYLNNGPNYYFATAKMSGATGAWLWTVYEPSTASTGRSSLGYGVAVDSGDNVVAVGWSPSRLALAFKYTPAGARVWTSTLGSTVSDAGYAVAVERGTDELYFAGYYASTYQAWVIKTGTDGVPLWRHDVAGIRSAFQDLALDDHGNVIATGYQVLSSSDDFLTQKLAPPSAVITIEATGGPGGSITPNGEVPVTRGSDVTFSMVPDQCYAVEDVVVNGSSLGPLPTHTFTSVAVDQTINATFAVHGGPPVANPGPDRVVEATAGGGTTVTLDGSSSSDPDGDALTFEWRDEASQVVGNSAVVSLSLPLGVHAFTLTVSDAGCGQDTATVRITVRDDGAPTITISSPVAGVYELGQPVVAQYACADAVSGVASCSGTVPNGAPVPTGTAGAHVFEVSAADGAGNNATATVSYEVSKGVPRIEWTNPAPILVGTPLGAVQLNATASVPGAFVYSPPAGTVLGVGVGQLLTATFEPADATNYASVVATATITVLPLPVDAVPPEVSNLVATPNPVAAGVSALTLTARIDDSATGASRVVTGQYRIDGGAWVQMAVADGAFDSAIETVTASVGPFPAAGVREICVRGGDAAGNLGGDTCTLVAIYDPNAGYVAGHGWIDSPPGAYPSDPTLGGRAQFAFTSKYAKGASVPTGSTEFKFKAAGFSFSSTVYEWLVVSGAKAQYRGQGAVNGVGGFRFFLSAIDGDVSGGQGVDRFRIRIWSDGGGLVYDNQIADAESSDPTTAVTAGNIVLHKSPSAP